MSKNFFGNPNGYQLPYVQTGIQNSQSMRALHMQAGMPCHSMPMSIMQKDPSHALHLFTLLDAAANVGKDIMDIYSIYGLKGYHLAKIRLRSRVSSATPLQLDTWLIESTNGIVPNQTYTVIPFGEQVLVNSVDGANQITVIRGVGSMHPVEIPKDTMLIISGNAHPEGALRPLPIYGTSDTMSVHTQILMNTWGRTGTQHAISKASGNSVLDMASTKEEAKLAHALSIEQALLLGQMSTSTMDNAPMRTMAGAREFSRLCAPQNIVSLAKPIDYEDACVILERFGEVRINGYSNSKRMLYGDRHFVRDIWKMGRNYHDFKMEDANDMFGRRFTGFITPTMEFHVYEHDLLNEMQSENSAGMGIVVAPNTMKLRYLRGRKTQHQYFNVNASGQITEQANDNGADVVGGHFLSELLVENHNPAAGGVLFNWKTKTTQPRPY